MQCDDINGIDTSSREATTRVAEIHLAINIDTSQSSEHRRNISNSRELSNNRDASNSRFTRGSRDTGKSSRNAGNIHFF